MQFFLSGIFFGTLFILFSVLFVVVGIVELRKLLRTKELRGLVFICTAFFLNETYCEVGQLHLTDG